tara:strand:+ start:311 stop:715 length:405 start_codon:yes stop_codon:yes gene_type:complete
MPIIQEISRKNPLDINKNVKIGVAFPLDSKNMFTGTPTTKEQVKNNLLNLLLTRKGERVHHPNFGIGLQEYLFEQSIDSDGIYEQIYNQIEIYIPEITLTDADIDYNPDKHMLIIKIIYEFNLDNTKDAISITI